MKHESIEQLRARILEEPCDLDLRFRYGVALFRSGKIHEAIPELQKARKHSDHRAAAARLLADIFEQLGMRDVAYYLRREAGDEEPPDPDSGSAPKPAPLRPITPLIATEAKELPNDSERNDSP